MIPKIIHCVWLGPKPLDELGQKCLSSWKQYLPDWDLRIWNESNSPMNHPFTKHMMSRKLYAFASDYIRLDALLKYGGLYMDTDVELLRNPTPLYEADRLSLGLLTIQNRLAKCSVATNLIAAKAGNSVLRDIQRKYDHLKRAIMNNTIFTNEIIPLFSRREIPRDGNFEFIDESGVRLYHPDYFNPVLQEERGKTTPLIRSRSVALHYGTGAWHGKQDPENIFRRILDYRMDRRFLRPIEKKLKQIVRKDNFHHGPIASDVAIPKIAHYVWLGGKPLSAIGQKCLRSWEKYLPGWEIRRWDESNSPVDHPFVKKMLAERKYAFASDYIRLHALSGQGGLYLDTDMELIGDVTPLLAKPCVLAFLSAQNRPSKNSAAMGFFASVPQHPWVVELRSLYDELRRAVMNTTLTTQSLQARGLGSLRDENPGRDFWELGDIRIYHSDFFYPPGSSARGFQPTFRTLGIHLAEGSWHGQATPLSPWRRFLDYRLDRKVLRPIENAVKKIVR